MNKRLLVFVILILYSYHLFSQIKPNHIPGLQLWLRADSSVVLNGSNVSQWSDCSGNGYNSIQATTANQPLYYSSVSTLNNKPALHFDG
ncbi:MAG TPA: hypothetical protein PKN48_15990, partial [Bacteroidales bacterium]|nr:hypothetical protein [Bacteroidales bacterium]